MKSRAEADVLAEIEWHVEQGCVICKMSGKLVALCPEVNKLFYSVYTLNEAKIIEAVEKARVVRALQALAD